MLKLKLQYFGHLMRTVDSLEKTDAGRDWGQEEKGTTKDEMAGWHHWLDGHESEWTPGVGDGQGGLLVCCDLWGRKEWDMTEQLNWTELNWILSGLPIWPFLQVTHTSSIAISSGMTILGCTPGHCPWSLLLVSKKTSLSLSHSLIFAVSSFEEIKDCMVHCWGSFQ